MTLLASIAEQELVAFPPDDNMIVRRPPLKKDALRGVTEWGEAASDGRQIVFLPRRQARVWMSGLEEGGGVRPSPPESLSTLCGNGEAAQPLGTCKVHDLNDPIMGDIAVRSNDKRHVRALEFFGLKAGFEFFNCGWRLT